MARPKKATGQITFRCPVGTHEELLEIATVLGVDLNAVLSMMVKQSLPSFRRRARELAQAHAAQARLGSEEVAVPTEEAVVRQMILAARQAPAGQRLEVLRDYAKRFGGPEDPPPDSTVLFALELMDRAAALHQLRRFRTEKGRWSLGAGEEQALGQLERRLVQEVERLKQQR